MRWITAQELSKIAKKSQDADKTVPERTIRHMALQKRIVTKKEGKTYLIDPASVLRAGLYIDPTNLESLRVTSSPPPQPSPKETQAPAIKVPEDLKKFTKLGELGVYNELRTLFLSKQSAFPEPVKDSLKQTLYHLALGFYDYPSVSKAEYFKRARKYLVGAIVEDDLQSETRSEWRQQVEDSIMPGIVGLIRKQEGGRRGQRGQSQTQRKA